MMNSEGISYSDFKKSIKPQNTKCDFSNQGSCNLEKLDIKIIGRPLKTIKPKVNKTPLMANSTAKIISVEGEWLKYFIIHCNKCFFFIL